MGLGWKFKCSGVKHSCDDNNLSRVTGVCFSCFGVEPDLSQKLSECNKCINSPSRPLPTPYPAESPTVRLQACV